MESSWGFITDTVFKQQIIYKDLSSHLQANKFFFLMHPEISVDFRSSLKTVKEKVLFLRKLRETSVPLQFCLDLTVKSKSGELIKVEK